MYVWGAGVYCVWCDACGRCVWQVCVLCINVCVVCEGYVSGVCEYVWGMSVCGVCGVCLCLCG